MRSPAALLVITYPRCGQNCRTSPQGTRAAHLVEKEYDHEQGRPAVGPGSLRPGHRADLHCRPRHPLPHRRYRRWRLGMAQGHPGGRLEPGKPASPRCLARTPTSPATTGMTSCPYVLEHRRIGPGEHVRSPVSRAPVVTMQVACMAEDAEDVKQSLFDESGRCWYLGNIAPWDPSRSGFACPRLSRRSRPRRTGYG